MTVIGITGPTGAGKTSALQVLEGLGVRVLDCDALYHQLLETSTPLRQELAGRFGPVFDGAGRLDRKKLGGLVWGDPQALRDLNGITRKYILARLEEELAAAQAAGAPGAAIDAVGLLDSPAGDLCQVKVAILAPKEERIRRIMARDQISRDYAQARVDAQHEDGWFSSRCHHTLWNDGDPAQFQARARALFLSLFSGEGADFATMEEWNHV